jgi:glucose/arabinose dehydrogenase
MTAVKDGSFYGWPYAYWGGRVDDRVKPQRPDLVAKTIKPDFALGVHTAPLGMAFYTGALLPPHYQGGAFVAQHGSWNRDPQAGYRVIYLPFSGGQPTGAVEPFLTGFLSAKGDAYGRPVDVIQDSRGALLVTDDVGNVVWRITPTAQPVRTPQ